MASKPEKDFVTSNNNKKRKRGISNCSSNHSDRANVKRRCNGLKSDHRSQKAKPRLPRPKKPLTFTLPKQSDAPRSLTPLTSDLQTSHHAKGKGKDDRSRGATPTQTHLAATSTSEKSLLRLTKINIILTGVHRRNKNQHRNQQFFKHFSVLRRSITKLITLYEQSITLSTPTSAPPLAKATTQQLQNNAAETRRRFEKEAQLRSQREMLEEYIRETIVPAAYVTFSSVVADTQFANLGVVLLGMLADVVGVVGSMRRVERIEDGRTGRSEAVVAQGGRLVGLSTLITGPDQGAVMERVYDSDHGNLIEEGSRNHGILQSEDEKNGKGVDMGTTISRDDFSKWRTPTEDRHQSEQQDRGKRHELVKDATRSNDPSGAVENSDGVENEGFSNPHKSTGTTSQPTTTATTEPQQPEITNSNTVMEVKNNSIKTQRVPTVYQDASTTSIDQASAPAPTQPKATAVTRPKLPMESVSRSSKADEDEEKTTKVTRQSQEKTEKKIKKKKKGNAIDDLFSGF